MVVITIGNEKKIRQRKNSDKTPPGPFTLSLYISLLLKNIKKIIAGVVHGDKRNQLTIQKICRFEIVPVQSLWRGGGYEDNYTGNEFVFFQQKSIEEELSLRRKWYKIWNKMSQFFFFLKINISYRLFVFSLAKKHLKTLKGSNQMLRL
ncbi:hypothetical protein B9Z55_027996 [Caenorhabditis nigoni]|uniref:Uncharacterized protein n=1 Tax=Caenorhabditis nigoni TaxID=1611254 RepID=A0A2G5SE29_9PELO|nr:hypothetical protein B9Z55_027996 [Caenorhabditis nigoni]